MRCEKEGNISPAGLLTMNWLCDNVVGTFPGIDMLLPRAVDFVRRQGILETAAPDESEIRVEERKS